MQIVGINARVKDFFGVLFCLRIPLEILYRVADARFAARQLQKFYLLACLFRLQVCLIDLFGDILEVLQLARGVGNLGAVF